MLDKIVGVLIHFFGFYIFYDLSRISSAYLPKMRIKRYIIIRNERLAKMLIAKQVGRDKIVQSWDKDKMSIVGLMSYIFVAPINVVYLILNLMQIFGYNDINNIAYLLDDIKVVLGVVLAVNWIVLLVNVVYFDNMFS